MFTLEYNLYRPHSDFQGRGKRPDYPNDVDPRN